MGQIKFDIGKDVSFVTPYNDMNTKCPTIAPDFKRTENC